MKICSPQLGLSPTSHLGGEVYDFNIIENLCRIGNKVYVLLPKGRNYKKNKNLIVTHLPIMHIVPPHIFNLLALPYIFNRYSKHKFDILRVHNPYFLGLAAWIFKKIHPNVKIITDILLKEERVDLDLILRNTINIYDHVFVLTDYLKNWLVTTYNYDPNKISIIYGGVDQSIRPKTKATALVKKFKLQNRIVLLYMGLLISRKNPLFLLEVFKKLLSKHKNLSLIFCGTGPLKAQLLRNIDDFDLRGKAFVIDPLYGSAKNEILNICDIFAFPTLNEGFGLVVAEAMACKKAVIASDNSSLPELINHGNDGFLAKTNDEKDWIKKTEMLIANRKLRRKLAYNAFRKAQLMFSWEQVARTINTNLPKTRWKN